jgi:hypothetical protein
MKYRNLILKIFCKDLLDHIEKLEKNVSKLTDERDNLSAKLEAAELAYNMLRTEYDNYRNNHGNARPVKVPHCKSCKSCKRKEVAVGKVIFSCGRLGGKRIFVEEGRTSPKWCPLRQRATLAELTVPDAEEKLVEEAANL